MTDLELNDVTPIFNGRTEKELHEAFAVVRNPRDWKAPIDIDLIGIAPEEAGKYLDAIVFFTATEATARATPSGIPGVRATKIKALGYRLGPAGDH